MSHGSADQRARRHARWQISAQRRGRVARLLWPLSLLYRALVGLRRWLYGMGALRIQRLPVPVVVVGNVVVGGAGKTPTVIALVHHFKSKGWRPGVISRGYGRSSEAVTEVTAGTPHSISGDEPALIHRATGVPVCVAPRRIDAGEALLSAHPDINLLLCDDGLQHHALARDLSVAVFDQRGAGNGWLLPAGLLREPWPPRRGSLNAPDLVLRQSQEGKAPTSLALTPGTAVFEGSRRLADHAWDRHGNRKALSEFQDQALTAVAGIAQPHAFFEMLRARGLLVAREFPVPDHAGPEAYGDALRHAGALLLCTEKDAVKLFEMLERRPGPGTPDIWAVPLELRPDPAFFAAVDAHLAPFKAPQ